MNKFIISSLFVFISAFSYAQKKQDWEKINTLKVAFISEKLSLSTKEAQQFWPLYNDYKEKRDALRKKEYHQIKSKIKDSETLSEKEAVQLLNQHIQLEEEEEVLDNEYLRKVSKVISAKKTLLLLRSEEEFKRQLIKQYRQNKGGR